MLTIGMTVLVLLLTYSLGLLTMLAVVSFYQTRNKRMPWLVQKVSNITREVY